jgi:hypothetical protein
VSTLKGRKPKFELNTTPQERYIVEQTLKTGNLNIFSEHCMRLPNSGTRWMPDDSLGHTGICSTMMSCTMPGRRWADLTLSFRARRISMF